MSLKLTGVAVECGWGRPVGRWVRGEVGGVVGKWAEPGTNEMIDTKEFSAGCATDGELSLLFLPSFQGLHHSPAGTPLRLRPMAAADEVVI